MTGVKTCCVREWEEKEDSRGKVYFCSQERRVVVPKRPVLGYWGAWMCESVILGGEVSGLWILLYFISDLRADEVGWVECPLGYGRFQSNRG